MTVFQSNASQKQWESKQFNMPPSWVILLWKLRAPWNNLIKQTVNLDILEWERSKTQNWSSQITLRLEEIMSIYWYVSNHANLVKRRLKKREKIKRVEQYQKSYIPISSKLFVIESLISTILCGWNWRTCSMEAEVSYFLNWLNTQPRILCGTSI